MKMIHEERTSQNVITPHPPPPKPPQPTPSVWTPMSRQWRWSMKNALPRTLSHPTPPLAQLRLYFKGERNIESVLRLYFEGERRICSSSCTPPHPQLTCASILEAKGALNLSCAFIIKENFWLLKRSFFGCWKGPFLVSDSVGLGCWLGRSWLLTRMFLVADSVGCWLGCFSCWLLVADSGVRSCWLGCF